MKEPGRELDALISKHVMGQNLPTEVMYVPGDYPVEVTLCPFYSTQISAAWEVAEVLAQKFDFQISRYPYHGQGDAMGWIVRVNGDRMGLFPSENAAHLICLAALKAVGVEP